MNNEECFIVTLFIAHCSRFILKLHGVAMIGAMNLGDQLSERSEFVLKFLVALREGMGGFADNIAFFFVDNPFVGRIQDALGQGVKVGAQAFADF